MKVIFLDIDGCLNDVNTTDRIFGNYVGLDTDKIERLNQIIKTTGAKIVLSSTWRKDVYFKNYLRNRMYEVDPSLPDAIIGLTPSLYATRADEIDMWMSENDDLGVTHFVVLDDLWDEDLERFGKNFVRTSESEGLTEEIKNRCINILGRTI